MSSIDPDLMALARMMIRQHPPGEIIRALAEALKTVPEKLPDGAVPARYDGRGEQVG